MTDQPPSSLFCFYCENLLNDPHSLVACGHTFCKECCMKSTGSCTLCGRENSDENITSQNEGEPSQSQVELFQPNEPIALFLKLIDDGNFRIIPRHPKIKCGSEKCANEASWSCSRCDWDMCNHCLNTEHVGRAVKNHTPVQLEQKKPNLCPEGHSGDPVFCATCCKVICISCKFADHPQHLFKNLQAELDQVKEHISSSHRSVFEDLSKNFKTQEDKLGEFETKLKNQLKQVQEIKQKISQSQFQLRESFQFVTDITQTIEEKQLCEEQKKLEEKLFDQALKFKNLKFQEIQKAQQLFEELNIDATKLERMRSTLPTCELVMEYEFDRRRVFLFRINAQSSIGEYKYAPTLLGKFKWFSPKSKEDAQALIDNGYELRNQHGFSEFPFIITYQVETDPTNRLFGGYLVQTDGGGAHSGDDNISGRCNGSSFTAIRKHCSSFANPNYFGKACCWNPTDAYSIAAFEEDLPSTSAPALPPPFPLLAPASPPLAPAPAPAPASSPHSSSSTSAPASPPAGLHQSPTTTRSRQNARKPKT